MTKINREFSHIVPREVDSEVRLIKFLSLRDMLIMVSLVMVANNFSGAVHPKIQLLYFIFTLIVGMVLVIPAYKDNAGKKTFEVIYLILLHRRQTFYSAEDPIEEMNCPEPERQTSVQGGAKAEYKR